MVASSKYTQKLITAEAAVHEIRSGDSVYIHSNAAAPLTLIEALAARSGEVKDVHIYQIITLGAAPYAKPECESSFRVHTLFVGPNTRAAVNDGRADYTPLFFSDLVWIFESRTVKIDVCLLQCSPPDSEGNLTLGVSLDCTLAAMKHARLVIAEVNPRMPATHGRSRISLAEVDFLVETDHPLPELEPRAPGKAEQRIGKHIASLVDDGATIQMGIGEIPNAVLYHLRGKRNLGVHSEMLSDGVLDLVGSGVVTNSHKTVIPGKMAVSFAMGTQRLYDFLDDNSLVEFHPTDFINDPFVIAQNERMTSINAALQIDLTGQVCADSLGMHMYSGCGGQVDFVRGAWRARDGKSIIALPSTARDDTISRVVATLEPGAGVVTTRADVQYVVTEYGIVNLRGKSLIERARLLIGIAHPAFREELEFQCRQFPWFERPPTVPGIQF